LTIATAVGRASSSMRTSEQKRNLDGRGSLCHFLKEGRGTLGGHWRGIATGEIKKRLIVKGRRVSESASEWGSALDSRM